jgi:ferritin
MKDIVRIKTSLSEDIERLLNEQIKMESKSSAIYLSMASWCDREGFQHCAEFFYRQSDEERTHMMKIFRYINEAGGMAISPEITGLPVDFDAFKSIFEQALEQEIDVTQSINQIVDQCHKLKDYTTANFLRWFLEEQLEEENTARRCLELFDIIGEEGHGKYLIDKAIGKINEAEDAGA